ncbi:MAG: carboxypeptidase regulatory-like domain-containing protein [Nitrospirae bacterium]|nr:carboxypeptidase regulatory-like domain-containing protein [Candidatus Troglogloeales bacterium]
MKNKISYQFILAVLFLGVICFLESPLQAYEEIDVQDGATIKGKVILKGPIPEPRVFSLVSYPTGSFCKKISDGEGRVLLEEFYVGAGGGLQDAVVSVQKVQKGKPFPRIHPKWVVEDCMFHPVEATFDEKYVLDKDGQRHHEHPLVTVVEDHQAIVVQNLDPVVHNTQVYQNEKGNIILNVPLPPPPAPGAQNGGGMLHFGKGKRTFQMICGAHEFMQSYGFVVDNPYYFKTKKDGDFNIDRLPPGTYKITAWYPHLQPVEKEVTVTANGTVNLDFEFDATQVHRPAYESQAQFRIRPEAHPEDHLMHHQPFRQRPPS